MMKTKIYLYPNIYNKNDFNVIIDGKNYGLPNDNMQLNEKAIFEIKNKD